MGRRPGKRHLTQSDPSVTSGPGAAGTGEIIKIVHGI